MQRVQATASRYYPVVVKTAVHLSGSALNRVGQVASAVNALLIFTSFFGLLGAGIFLHAADTLIHLHGQPDELTA